jgi:hypothetical protein
MPSNSYPVYNGVEPSWADVLITTTGDNIVLAEMKDLASIKMGRSVEVGLKKFGGRVMSRTTGEQSQEFSWVFYRLGYQRFLRSLMAQAEAKNFKRGNQLRISLVTFNVQVQHTPPGSNEIFDRRAKGLRVIGDSMDLGEGVDADKVEVPVSVIEIVDMIDGKEVVLL